MAEPMTDNKEPKVDFGPITPILVPLPTDLLHQLLWALLQFLPITVDDKPSIRIQINYNPGVAYIQRDEPNKYNINGRMYADLTAQQVMDKFPPTFKRISLRVRPNQEPVGTLEYITKIYEPAESAIIDIDQETIESKTNNILNRYVNEELIVSTEVLRTPGQIQYHGLQEFFYILLDNKPYMFNIGSMANLYLNKTTKGIVLVQ